MKRGPRLRREEADDLQASSVLTGHRLSPTHPHRTKTILGRRVRGDDPTEIQRHVKGN